MTRRKQPEAQLQRSLIEHLGWCARGDVWWTHVPTGGRLSPIEAAIFNACDLLIICAGQPLFLELKVPGRKPSPVQTECHDAINSALAFLVREGGDAIRAVVLRFPIFQHDVPIIDRSADGSPTS